MNKKLKISLYVLAGIVIFYHILKFAGILVVYSVPTTGSTPNIKRGSFIVVSNLITPKRGDFITYAFNDPTYGKSTMIHRLCGVENDTIQIIEGTLFVNRKNFDANYNLQHSYILSEEKMNTLDETITKDGGMIGEKTYLTFIEDTDAEKQQLNAYRIIDEKTKSDPKMKEVFQQDWNKDHFGPLIIPKGKIFVLGDNRDNSMDSRAYGLIDEEAITGVLWKTLFVWSSE